MSRPVAHPPSPNDASQRGRSIAHSARRNVIDLFEKDKAAPATANPIDVHVGSRLRLKRRACGLTRERLAASAGVGVAQLEQMEAGSLRIDARLFRDLAMILNAPPSYFFANFGVEPATPGK